MKKSVILILSILSLSGCFSDSEELKTVTVENKYSVLIPSFLNETNELNKDASLQYRNKWKDICFITIDDLQSNWSKALSKGKLTELYTDDLKGYSDYLWKGIEEVMSINCKPEPLDTLINNMPARIISFPRKAGGLDLFYSLAFIEGKDQYYQLMVWTTANKKEKYKDMMNQIIYSFKEF